MTKLYAGLDASLEMTSVSVVDEDGRICLERRFDGVGLDPESRC